MVRPNRVEKKESFLRPSDLKNIKLTDLKIETWLKNVRQPASRSKNVRQPLPPPPPPPPSRQNTKFHERKRKKASDYEGGCDFLIGMIFA